MELLAFDPKHPIRDKFTELHFLADIDTLIRNMRENNVPSKNCSKLRRQQNGTQKRETFLDGVLAKVRKYLRDNALIYVPFDEVVGFYVVKKNMNAEKLQKVPDSKQIRKLEESCDNIVGKKEELNKELLDKRKKGRYRLRFTKL